MIRELPKEIQVGLISYMKYRGVKLDDKVRDWFLNNPEARRNKPIKLYRGFEVDDDSDNAGRVIQKLRKFTRTKNFGKLHIGNGVKYTRGKESSWSYKTETPQTFAFFNTDIYGIGIIMEAIINPEDVILDTKLLSRDIFIPYRSQQEVIVRDTTIHCKIFNIRVSEDFMDLRDFGYNMVYRKDYGYEEA